MKFRITAIAAFFMVQIITPATADDGIAGVYCMQGRSILEGQTFYMRDANIPVDSARDTVISMFRDNIDAARFMISSVNAVYSQPDQMRARLVDGSWHAYCVKSIRGF